MFALKPRTSEQGVDFHRTTPARIYEKDGCHGDRITKAREAVELALKLADSPDPWICELGCGTGDISGHFTDRAKALLVDCNIEALKIVQQRFPLALTNVGPIDSFKPFKATVVVMCEILEHLQDPLSVVEKWLPMSEYAVISHPIDEPADSPLSAGEHQWSFNDFDFQLWFSMGNHELIERETFRMGSYTIALGVGKRKA